MMYRIFDSGQWVSAKEYFKDKPPDYSKSVEFVSLQDAQTRNWVRKPVICDKVALIGTSCFFNPFFDPIPYIQSQGYQIVPGDGMPTSGAAVYCLKKV
jgi:hypothetical protein